MKLKALLPVLALAVILVGGSFLYAFLGDKAPPPDIPLIDPAAVNPDNCETEYLAAPDFTVQDESGNPVKLSDMLGKPVVLNFWASWCPPCRGEMPEFNKVYGELGGTVQFMMVNAVGVNGETMEAGASYVAGEGFEFPVFYDTQQDAVNQYGIRAFPTTIFIDAEGFAVTGVEGMIDEKTLLEGIALLMGANARYKKITPEQAKIIMGGNDPYILLDVRTKEEFASGRITGAVLIPDNELADRALAELPDKSATILVYCRSGRRSEGAARELVEMGYVNVYDFGGVLDWPYEIEQ